MLATVRAGAGRGRRPFVGGRDFRRAAGPDPASVERERRRIQQLLRDFERRYSGAAATAARWAGPARSGAALRPAHIVHTRTLDLSEAQLERRPCGAVALTIDEAELKAAFRKQALARHPDTADPAAGGGEDAFRRAVEAYEALRDYCVAKKA
jgi:hypothetical protein